LTDLPIRGWDRGQDGTVVLVDGTRTSPHIMGRFELSIWQGTHQENRPLVFRVDLPNGWYRVTCTSVDPTNIPILSVNQRGMKCLAHDVVFADPSYGAPLKIEENRQSTGNLR